MGLFLLHFCDNRWPLVNDLYQQVRSAGFSFHSTLRLGEARLDLFRNIPGNYPTIAYCSLDEFIVCYGEFCYDGKFGKEALYAFHRDYDPKFGPPPEVHGHFTCILSKQNNIYIVNDPLGVCKTYCNTDHTMFSNSFLAIVWFQRVRRFDLQGCFEYVFAGSCYGTGTFVEGVTSIPHDHVVAVTERRVELLARPPSMTHRCWPASAALDDIAQHHVSRLRAALEPFARRYGDQTAVSMSGGFDSRLILATLLDIGVRPRLFTYGGDEDLDVKIARCVAETEGLELVQVDKSQAPPLDPEELATAVRRDFIAFDGWKAGNGIFSSGVDYLDRVARQSDGWLPMNGSLGEIYRNFFYLADRAYSTEDIVSSFYSGYDPRAGGELFVDKAYRAQLAMKIQAAVGSTSPMLTRAAVERVYPEFRGRYWTGRDAQLNHHFGPMLFPFLDASVISDTATIPLKFKSLGILQGRMIELQNPRLAHLPSTYGYGLAEPRTKWHFLASSIRNRRPMLARRWSYILRYRSPEPRPLHLSMAQLRDHLDQSLPFTSRLFNVSRLHENALLNRALTLEYTAQTLQFADAS